MDKLQRQVMELNYKVDRLSQIVEKIIKKTSLSPGEMGEKVESTRLFYSSLNDDSSADEMIPPLSKNVSENSLTSKIPIIMAHKDIIEDEERNYIKKYDYSNSQQVEQEMSCELQVQRLTAQLTAAYHRIAALEEQLLAQRNQ